MLKVWGVEEKARRILQAAAVDAFGRPGVFVLLSAVMKQANITDEEEGRAIVEYLEWQGWIDEADANYGVFVLTTKGIDISEH